MIENIKNNLTKIPYTFKHKIIMIKLERQFTNKNTIRILLHDLDKLFMCIFMAYLNPKIIAEIHRKIAKHHQYEENEIINKSVLQEIVLDWESARYSKSDKPMSAREFCTTYKWYMLNDIESILDEWNI